MSADSPRAEVIPFRDPQAALEGEARLDAIARYREGMGMFAHRAMCRAFREFIQLVPGAGRLSGADVVALFVEAMRRELDRTGL